MERPESAEDADSVKDPAAEPQTSKVLSEAG
jgi:hypothetical protein